MKIVLSAYIKNKKGVAPQILIYFFFISFLLSSPLFSLPVAISSTIQTSESLPESIL